MHPACAYGKVYPKCMGSEGASAFSFGRKTGCSRLSISKSLNMRLSRTLGAAGIICLVAAVIGLVLADVAFVNNPVVRALEDGGLPTSGGGSEC